MSNFIEKIKDKLFPKPDLDFDDDFNDDSEEIGEVEIDYESPQSVSEAKKKNLVIIVVALVLSVVLYFVMFDEEEVKEDLVKPVGFSGSVGSAKSPFKIEEQNVQKEEEVTFLETPVAPELPDLPDVEDPSKSDDLELEDSLFEEELPDSDNEEVASVAVQLKGNASPVDNKKPRDPNDPEVDFTANSDQSPATQTTKREISDPKYAPIIVVKGSPGSNISGIGTENNLKILDPNQVIDVKDSLESIVPRQIKDRENVVAQGKIINAVLETAIDTELEGSARAIVSRDVYGEVGNKILMPKGSRLYGSYSSSKQKGQARVKISWNRLIRPDGISLNINSTASDQFGRAGVEGSIDNKVQETIANTFLSSVLAIAGVAATEALTGGANSTTTTDPTSGTSTVTQTAINQAVTKITNNITESAQQAVGGLFDTRPRITIPQGTRINIIVNSDIKVPSFER